MHIHSIIRHLSKVYVTTLMNTGCMQVYAEQAASMEEPFTVSKMERTAEFKIMAK